MKKILLLIIICSANLFSQDDLDALLEQELTKTEVNITNATFKSTRLCNGHTIERVNQGELEFRVHHRFDYLNTGIDDFFGLDESASLISLEYGLFDWLMFGISRTTIEKTWGSFVKFSILRQSSGAKNIPISLSYLAQLAKRTLNLSEDNPYNLEKYRMYYTNQLLIARKFNPNFSLQIMPAIVHRNLINSNNDNDLYVFGIGGRYKFTKWMSINLEYYYTINPDFIQLDYAKDSFSLGFDLDTGGHIFQLLITNSPYLFEHQFISKSTGEINGMNIMLGFNIMRRFSLF